VYLRLIAAVLERGRRALVLVPEIALTPQAIHRYGVRFPGQVVAMHSRLTPRERIEAWRAVRDGRVDVVVGSRSSLFATIERLGAVVVDEEHEPSFKQEIAPRYHGREAALALGRLAGAVVVLGSATPDLGTYERAWRGELELLELPQRVPRGGSATPSRAKDPSAGPVRRGAGPSAQYALERGEGPQDDRRPLPKVEVVDMRHVAGDGAGPLFSPRLVELLSETLARKEQSILFLNRRGTATIVICATCGYVPRCRRCDVALVYHAASDDMVCHQCDRRTKAPELCPACDSVRLQYFGAGTQRVVLELQRLLPTARVIRWDRDAMSKRHTAEELSRRFAAGEFDVLVGTQAIAKGLDLPGVTLVGVITADTLLHLPDLRAAERTFQLLTQVAGRAGRGPVPGRVVLQTYTPEHACIRAAARHDYASFARAELRFRREHGYPPFANLARAVFASTSEAQARAATAKQATALRGAIDRVGLGQTWVVGPAPCYYRRVRGRYRWQLLLRGREVHQLVREVDWGRGWALDVDPVSLL
jgi:primosomal protein N' (replication factor Y)